MKIKKLQIKNFKSLVEFELQDLKPFCAFVGPNASGKSNIFEALEFTNYILHYNRNNQIDISYFGGDGILSYQSKEISSIGGVNYSNLRSSDIAFYYEFADTVSINFYVALSTKEGMGNIVSIGRKPEGYFNHKPDVLNLGDRFAREQFANEVHESGFEFGNEYEQFVDNFSRIFVGKSALLRFPAPGKLNVDASNLSSIIGQIFADKSKREDFIDWLRILIPEFDNIEVKRSSIDGSFAFSLYEKSSRRPFPTSLISDGTYNLISLMAAVYQSNQPQFLCIEEPENGLHPQAIELLVDFFRENCEENGHHIWLNTHSQTLVRCLEIEEVILVNKINGSTKAKQLNKLDNVDIRTDEAWLTNALGGGVL